MDLAGQFLVDLGPEGQMALAAGVLCRRLEHDFLASSLEHRYRSASPRMQTWTWLEVQCGYMFLIATQNRFTELYFGCVQRECDNELDEKRRWDVYETELLNAYRTIHDPDRYSQRIRFTHDLESVGFMAGKEFGPDVP